MILVKISTIDPNTDRPIGADDDPENPVGVTHISAPSIGAALDGLAPRPGPRTKFVVEVLDKEARVFGRSRTEVSDA